MEETNDKTQTSRAESGTASNDSAQILKEVLVTFIVVTVIISILYQGGFLSSWLKNNLGGIAAVLFVYGAAWRIWRNGKELSAYGITVHPISKNVIWSISATVAVLGVFLLLYIGYYTVVCGDKAHLLGTLGRDCRRFVGGVSNVEFSLPSGFWELLLAEFLVISLPEEFFFRGYIQGRLNEVWRGRRRIFGVELGWAWIVQAGLFGLGHFLIDFNPLRLAVALPALAFGYIREGTGSIGAAIIFHMCCNIFMTIVDYNFFPPL